MVGPCVVSSGSYIDITRPKSHQSRVQLLSYANKQGWIDAMTTARHADADAREGYAACCTGEESMLSHKHPETILHLHIILLDPIISDALLSLGQDRDGHMVPEKQGLHLRCAGLRPTCLLAPSLCWALGEALQADRQHWTDHSAVLRTYCLRLQAAQLLCHPPHKSAMCQHEFNTCCWYCLMLKYKALARRNKWSGG